MTAHGAAGAVHGFVFTLTRYSDRTIAREHPAYRHPDGRVVWAPNREAWRDALPDVAGTFLPAGDVARVRRLEIDAVAAAGAVCRVCREPVEPHGAHGWRHAHARRDVECWTGDGSTAYPVGLEEHRAAVSGGAR